MPAALAQYSLGADMLHVSRTKRRAERERKDRINEINKKKAEGVFIVLYNTTEKIKLQKTYKYRRRQIIDRWMDGYVCQRRKMDDKKAKKRRPRPGFEPGTCYNHGIVMGLTRNNNHTSRPPRRFFGYC